MECIKEPNFEKHNKSIEHIGSYPLKSRNKKLSDDSIMIDMIAIVKYKIIGYISVSLATYQFRGVSHRKPISRMSEF